MVIKLSSGEQVFHLGELWAGGDGMACVHDPKCTERTNAVLLSRAEAEALLAEFATDEEVVGRRGQLGGSRVSSAICNRNLGRVLCPNHLPPLT